MAMAPYYEQAQLLNAAIRKAAPILRAPIDRVEVAPGKVLFWARRRFWLGTKKLAISFRYVANPSPMPGSSPTLLLDGDEPAEFDGLRAGHAKLPPWREREELIDAAISKATTTLQAPIDRIEVTPDSVLLGAGSKEVAISYQFVANPSGLKPRGFLLDGQDYWECFEP